MAKAQATKIRQTSRCHICRGPVVDGVFRLSFKHPQKKTLVCGAH